MKHPLIVILLFISTQFCIGQKTASEIQKEYLGHVLGGLDALNAEKYDSCLIYFKAGFEIRQNSPASLLRASACAYSVNDRTYMNTLMDKAFDISWGTTKHVYDILPEFDYLRDTDYDKIVNYKFQSFAIVAGANVELIDEIEVIYNNWNKYRDEIYDEERRDTVNTDKVDSLTTLQNSIDTINLPLVIDIIDEHGVPGKSMVGYALGASIMDVLRTTAPISTREKYLPLIIDAAKNEELEWRRVSYYIDRLKESKGQKQIYGNAMSRDSITNERFFIPIENPMRVDSLRQSIGLKH